MFFNTFVNRGVIHSFVNRGGAGEDTKRFFASKVVCHDSFIRVTVLISLCIVTDAYVRELLIDTHYGAIASKAVKLSPQVALWYSRCSVLQCVAVCCSVLHHVTVCCNVLQRVAACCSALHSACCSALQRRAPAQLCMLYTAHTSCACYTHLHGILQQGHCVTTLISA